jgi:hypothetical protein
MEMPTLIPIGTLDGMEESYCFDVTSDWHGWIFHKHPDGQWVSWRQAGPQERECIENIYQRKLSESRK